MKAWVATAIGGPEVLELQDLPTRTAGPDEVRIAVRAFGINAAERYRRLGVMGPLDGTVVPAIEAVGEIIDDPAGVFAPGTAVATIMGGLQFDRTGSYAEEVVVLRSNVVALPETSLSWGDLAALPQSYLTAWGAVSRRLRISAGETLVVRGGTAALGLSTIAYATHVVGARVIATVRDESTIPDVQRFGARHVVVEGDAIADRVIEAAGGAVDGVLDVIGGPGIVDSTAMVRPFRDVAVVGLLAGPPVLDDVNIMTDLGPAVAVAFFPSQLVGTPALPITESRSPTSSPASNPVAFRPRSPTDSVSATSAPSTRCSTANGSRARSW